MKDVIENDMKEGPQVAPMCMPLSANTVLRSIEEMDNEVEETLTSEL